MIYLTWFLLVPVDVLMKLVGYVVAPIVSLFVDENGYLPDWLCWFETPDSNMFGFLGDRGFYEEHRYDTDTFWGRWWVCTKWQWRNTSHGFSVYVLGVDDRYYPLETLSESGEGDLKKYHKVVRERSGKVIGFDLKGSAKYPFINYRLRWRFGWKLRQDLNHEAQYVFSISPFKSIEE